MSKNNMISISSMDKIMKNIEESVTIDFYGEELIIKKYLSFDEMIKFVNEIVNGCFDGEQGIYMPEVKDFLTDINTVLYYSNVRLPEDIRHRYDILIKTDLVEIIKQSIDYGQYDSMMYAISEKIDSRLNINEQLFNNKISIAMSSIETLTNNIKDLFDGIDADDIKNLLNALNNNAFDEEKLVEAYMKSKEQAKDMLDNNTDPNEEASDSGETFVD